MINRNFAKENVKSNKTRRKLVETPSYDVQSPSTEKKCNKNFTETPQTSNKPPPTHLGRKVRSLKTPKN